MKRKILVLDTTLRDGEQVPGAKLDKFQKLQIAGELKKLNVDYIEAGFSSSSIGDFNSIVEIAKKFKNDSTVITALARAVKSDIDAVYNSVKYAYKPMIHIVLGSSDIHVEKKFSGTRDSVLQMGIDAVKYAKKFLNEVQYSTEDASRTEFEYLWRTIKAMIEAGATVINVPDTVGYAIPEEFGEIINKINYRMKNTNKDVILSVHCHNDMGMATANTLAAVKNGADKVECTINGIGERAGNAALEEVVATLKARKDYYGVTTNIATKKIKSVSSLVSRLMGLGVQVNKAIVGDNAFAHSSGIHQDGLLKSREVYEVIRPEDVGNENMELVLTARSGKHALSEVLTRMGCTFKTESKIEELHKKFLELADNKKEIYYHDIYKFIINNLNDKAKKDYKIYELVDLQIVSNSCCKFATVQIKNNIGKIFVESAVGEKVSDAIFNAIEKIVNSKMEVFDFTSSTVGEATRVNLGCLYKDEQFTSKVMDKDSFSAIAWSYLNAINKFSMENLSKSDNIYNIG